jgi:hypothetical protein
VFAVKYELGFYIPKDGILHSHRRENLKSSSLYTTVTPVGVTLALKLIDCNIKPAD